MSLRYSLTFPNVKTPNLLKWCHNFGLLAQGSKIKRLLNSKLIMKLLISVCLGTVYLAENENFFLKIL